HRAANAASGKAARRKTAHPESDACGEDASFPRGLRSSLRRTSHEAGDPETNSGSDGDEDSRWRGDAGRSGDCGCRSEDRRDGIQTRYTEEGAAARSGIKDK